MEIKMGMSLPAAISVRIDHGSSNTHGFIRWERLYIDEDETPVWEADCHPFDILHRREVYYITSILHHREVYYIAEEGLQMN